MAYLAILEHVLPGGVLARGRVMAGIIAIGAAGLATALPASRRRCAVAPTYPRLGEASGCRAGGRGGRG